MASESERDLQLSSKSFVRLEKFKLEDLMKMSSESKTNKKCQMNEEDECEPPPLPLPQSHFLLEEKVAKLEKALCQSQALDEEVQLISAQLSIINDWISTQFGVEIIDKKSSLLAPFRNNAKIKKLVVSLSLLSSSKSGVKVKSSAEVAHEGISITRRERGRPPAPAPGPRSSKNKSTKHPKLKPKNSRPKLQAEPRSSIFKGPLDAFVESVEVDNNNEDETEIQPGEVHIKDEIDLLDECGNGNDYDSDPFEEGFIPDVEDMEMDMDIIEEKAKGMGEVADPLNINTNHDHGGGQGQSRRPKRSATLKKTVSIFYDQPTTESEDEDLKKTGKQDKITGKRGRGRPRKVIEEDADADYKVPDQDESSPSHVKKKHTRNKYNHKRNKLLVTESYKRSIAPMQCDECGKTVRGPRSLQRHKESHADFSPYTCQVCGKKFRRNCLEKHMNREHKVVDESEPQDKGPKPAKNKKRYKYPNKKNYDRPMICEICGAVLKNVRVLKAHMGCHSEVRPHKCHLCGFAFRQKTHLTAHLMVHVGEEKKSLKCKFCDKSFFPHRRRDHARHERTHTGEKPYPCTFPNCTRRFNVVQHVAMHYRTHTGERPYKCTSCDMSFMSANPLRLHRKAEHEGKVKKRPGRKSQGNGNAASKVQIGLETLENVDYPKNTSTSTNMGAPLERGPLQSQTQSICDTLPPPLPPTPMSDIHIQPHPNNSQNSQNLSHTGAFDMAVQHWRQHSLAMASIESTSPNATGQFLHHHQIYEPQNMLYGGTNYPESDT